ncbi:MAG: hypothetical protein D6756_09320 [Cyanobacteria bacterium J083]|nr:MAG: hypothetical protein D6756_09320 [Cyanobacteria bacterium J083]
MRDGKPLASDRGSSAPINKTPSDSHFMLRFHFGEFLLGMKQVLTLVVKLQVDIKEQQLLANTEECYEVSL